MTFNNGTANYDPGSVSVKLGNIGGLENISYPSSFRFVDRLNMQSVGTFSITAGVPSAITWDANPRYVEGINGANLIRGYRPPSNSILAVFVLQPGTTGSVTAASAFVSGTLRAISSLTLTDESQKVTKIVVTAPGSAFTSAPTVVITSASGTGAAATAIINGQGFITAIVITNKGSGYATDPTITFTGGGGSGATATATRGTTNAVTSAAAPQAFIGQGTITTLPAMLTTDNTPSLLAQTSQLEAGGIEYNDVCFVRDPITQEVLTGIQCIPVWNGRLNSSGSPVYDDALVVIRPRVILSPTFNLSGSGASSVYSGTMDPVTDWVKGVLRYRRSCTVDIEVFGASRLLFLGKLTITNDA